MSLTISSKYITNKCAMYKMYIDSDTRIEYTIYYDRNKTTIWIYSTSHSQWHDLEIYNDIDFEVSSIIPMDEDNPMKTIDRFNKLMVLK